jgi:hypothetical protein
MDMAQEKGFLEMVRIKESLESHAAQIAENAMRLGQARDPREIADLRQQIAEKGEQMRRDDLWLREIVRESFPG